MSRRLAAFIGALMLALALAAPAWAAGEIHITGDRFVVNEDAHEATFTGKVYVQHPNLDLWADKVVIHYGEGGTTDVKTFEATGHVRIKSTEQDAVGDTAVYDPNTHILHLTGNVVVNSEASVLSGPELEVNLDTNVSTFTGSKGGRVTGVFDSQ
jgi:lipopolysaccharide export system protein LptA